MIVVKTGLPSWTVVDWKTSNYLYVEFLLQTAAYQAAYEEETGERIEDRWIIRLGKEDAEFDPWHMEGRQLFNEDFEAFCHALALVRSLRTLDDRIDVVKAAKSAHKKAEKSARQDAANLIACPLSDEYKGTRKKKGCNGTAVVCQVCTKKFEEANGRSSTKQKGENNGKEEGSKISN